MKCKYWNEEHQDCSVSNNTYEQGYNQALDDFEKCAIEKSIYTETEDGWSGMTVDAKTIKNIKEQLKR